MAWANTLFAYLNPFNWVGRQTLPPRRRYDLRRSVRHRPHQTFFFHVPVLGVGAGTKRQHESDLLEGRHTRVRFAAPDDALPTPAASEDSYTSTDEGLADAADASSLSSEEASIASWNSTTDAITPSSPSSSLAHRLSTSTAYSNFDPHRYTPPSILTNLPATCPPNTKSDPTAATKWHNLTRAAETTAGWPTPDADLYVHLALRGNEPLMPSKWEVDFPTLPGKLFVPQPADLGYMLDAPLPVLNSLGWDQQAGKDARAARVLQDLVAVGCYSRDLLHTSSHPRTRAQSRGQTTAETCQRRAIVAAIEWSIKDAGVSLETTGSHLPCLLVMQAEGETIAVLQQRCVRELKELRSAWLGVSGKSGRKGAPPVYAILCRGTRMAFVGLRDEVVDVGEAAGGDVRDVDERVEDAHVESQLDDEMDDEDQLTPSWAANATDAAGSPASAQPQQPLRIIDMYDWSKEEGQDVWIGVSVMMLAVHARDLMVEWHGLRDPNEHFSDDGGDDDEGNDGDDGDADEDGDNGSIEHGVEENGDEEEVGNNDGDDDEGNEGQDGEEYMMSGALDVSRPDEGKAVEEKREGEEEEEGQAEEVELDASVREKGTARGFARVEDLSGDEEA